jgi:hypothetical protein
MVIIAPGHLPHRLGAGRALGMSATLDLFPSALAPLHVGEVTAEPSC